MRMRFRVTPRMGVLPNMKARVLRWGQAGQLLSDSADQLVGELIPDFFWQVDAY